MPTMKQSKTTFLLLAAGLLVFAASATTLETEPRPTYRYMLVYGTGDLAVGDTVEFHTAAGVLCGRWTVLEEGGYGLMSVFGNDPATAETEGARPGEMLFIRVNGREITAPGGSPVWRDSRVPVRIDL